MITMNYWLLQNYLNHLIMMIISAGATGLHAWLVSPALDEVLIKGNKEMLFLIPIEIIGMFVKPFALIMRLGANMTAGHIGMVAIFALPIILGNGIADPNNLNY